MTNKPTLSLIIPMHNEAENAAPLVREIREALSPYFEYEVILVDDGSTDATPTILEGLAKVDPSVRFILHESNYGQSASVCSGVHAAKHQVIATLDGDGQNPPSEIKKLFDAAQAQEKSLDHYLIAGHRVKRKDTWIKRISSRIANAARKMLLRDDCPDSGCGLKLFDKKTFLSLPHFNHMHRFLPALFKSLGAEIINVPIKHRTRRSGVSKYGTWDRFLAGLGDLLGVAWLVRRHCQPRSKSNNVS